MPIYEYQCSACGHQLEAMQKISDQPLSDCPACGKPTLTKLVSAAGFQLKGSGWYKTDYSEKGKPKPAAEKADSGSGETSKDNQSAGSKTKETSSGNASTSSASGESS